jgi:hypothetical protein
MTDFYKMSSMMKDLFPSTPQQDKQALLNMANNAPADIPPTKDYINESTSVPEGSMPLGIDSISDFAKLAGITEKQKMGSAGQAKGKDPMPKLSKPTSGNETPHPLKDKLVGEKDQDDPSIAAVDNSLGQSSLAKEIGYSPTGEVYKALIRAIKAVMPDALEDKIKQAALAAVKKMEESVSEDDIDITALTPAATTLGGAIDPDMDPSALIARGLKKAGEGDVLNDKEREAIKPYIALFSELMSNPAFRNNLIAMQKILDKTNNKKQEDAPPGREKQVKKLKKKFDDPGAPYAIAWAQHNKHGKPKKKTESIKEELYKALAKYKKNS